MASNSKNIAELLNTDTTVNVTDVADGSITTAKIAAGAVDTTELASGAVTSAKLDTNIDVAGNLTVDTNTLYVNSSNDCIGVKTSLPGTSFLDSSGTHVPAYLLEVSPGNAAKGGMLVGTSGRAGAGTDYRQGYFLRRNDGWVSTDSGMYKGSDTTGSDYWENLVISNGGGGGAIVFKANGAERMRLGANGGLSFNGDTAADNQLDDYEEGAFTPTVTGSSSGGPFTFSSNNCRYVKIGRLVKASYWLVHNGSITFSGAYKITLPFTVSGDYAGGGYISYFQSFIGTKPDIFQIEANTNFGYLRRLISSNDNQQFDLDPAMFQTNTGFMLTVMYETNS